MRLANIHTCSHALAVQKLLRERYIPEITKIKHYDGTNVDPPLPVPWYPDELAWWMTTPKNVVRRFPPFAAFQKYLVSETSVGNISRQEVVSMIPPLLMDVEPGMAVLDMCAAPGSKAAQLLEMLHRGEEVRIRQALKDYSEDGRVASPGLEIIGNDEFEIEIGDYGRATGLLIANDSDFKRSHMLIHQLKRLSSPNLIVTNHDATMFPSIKLPLTPGKPPTNRYLKFDRILADVPCSGDGTCRKNPNLWHDWGPGNALGLYITQVRILVRALQMLKVGGRVVYSTCSMNPVENEAVVSSAIRRCGGLVKVQLLDCSNRLPLLKRSSGLTRWSVMDKSGRIWSDWESVAEENEKYGEQTATVRLVEGMFAPNDKDAEKIPFERCIRVYPHLQDTGGFFIAVLQKMKEFKAIEPDSKKLEDKPAIIEGRRSRPVLGESGDATREVRAASILTDLDVTGNVDDVCSTATQNQRNHGYEESASFKRGLESDVEEATTTKKSKTNDDIDTADLDMEDQGAPSQPFPAVLPGQPYKRTSNLQGKIRPKGQPFEEPFKYITTNHVEVRTIEMFYNLSPRFPRDRFMVRNVSGDPAKTIYYTSALVRDILVENEGNGIKFVHGGVRMFMKQDVQSNDVCKWRIQYEGMPILEGYVGEQRVVHLYRKKTLRILLIEMFPKVDGGGWKNLGEIGERVRDMTMGCCVLRIEPSDQEDGFDERMVLPLWRSQYSLNLMLAKEDRTAMLLRIFNDSTPLVNNHNPKNADSKKDPTDLEAALEDETDDREITLNQDSNIAHTLDNVDIDPDAMIVPSSNGEIAAVEDLVGFAESGSKTITN
jgi:multisite-specific tRNA:(cytosine-C5)-methyltransferase